MKLMKSFVFGKREKDKLRIIEPSTSGKRRPKKECGSFNPSLHIMEERIFPGSLPNMGWKWNRGWSFPTVFKFESECQALGSRTSYSISLISSKFPYRQTCNTLLPDRQKMVRLLNRIFFPPRKTLPSCA